MFSPIEGNFVITQGVLQEKLSKELIIKIQHCKQKLI